MLLLQHRYTKDKTEDGKKKLPGIWAKSPVWKQRTRSAVFPTAVNDIRWMHLTEKCFHSAIQQSESNVNKTVIQKIISLTMFGS